MDDAFLTNNNLVELKGEPFIIDMMYALPKNIIISPVYQEVGFGNKAYYPMIEWNKE